MCWSRVWHSDAQITSAFTCRRKGGDWQTRLISWSTHQQDTEGSGRTVPEYQAIRGQILMPTEPQARYRSLNLVVACLGAIRKEKPTGVVTARVLFDDTRVISVNRRTRIRDQERAPIALASNGECGNSQRLENQRWHWQRMSVKFTGKVPIHPKDFWHLLGCQVQEGL